MKPISIQAGSWWRASIFLLTLALSSWTLSAKASDLIITGVIDGPLTGGIPKAIELYALVDIPDLSIYGLGSANNGGGTDGQEFTFPADAVNAGDFLYVATETTEFTNFFGFAPNYTDGAAPAINGDDAVELFLNTVVVDVFGDINLDGTGQTWDYLDGWAYRSNSATVPSTTFTDTDWYYSGSNALDGETSNATAATPFPLGTYANGANLDPGVTLSKASIAVTENGPSSSYTVALNTTPTAQVDITVTVTDHQTEISTDGVNYSQSIILNLTDTSAALVHVRAIDDAEVEGNHQSILSHTASSTDSDYHEVAIDDLTVNITDNDIEVTKIHNIQGSSMASPLDGETVAIEGIVVGDFQDYSELKGFFVQEEDTDIDTDPNTSEGIFVYSTIAVDLGDRVRVTGTVDEYYNLTEITSVSDVTVMNQGILPSPAIIQLPLNDPDDLEAYEGMYVKLPQTLYVTEHYNLGRGGYVYLSANDRLDQPTNVVAPGTDANTLQAANDLNRILLDDGSQTQNPDPILFSQHPPKPLSAENTLRGGDSVTDLLGVLSYHWDGWSGSSNAYRVHPITPPNFIAANPRPTTAPHIGNTLKVAAFNVLNYFTTLDGSGPICGPLIDQYCRGADSASELIRQQDKLITALLALDADIIGLMELENTNQNALADLADRLSGYDYIANPNGNNTPLGEDVITVGFLYKTATVTPIGSAKTIQDGYGLTDQGTACGTESDGVYPFDNYNRKPLAQTFQDPNGETFTAVVNHFKSKGSLTDYFLDEDQGDGQGNNNCTRIQAATTLLEWINTDPTQSQDPDVLIMGDLNAYAMEDPVSVFVDAGYTNLASGHSYVYDGQWGSLDHLLGSASLTTQTASTAKWHINADEPRVLDYNEEYKSTDQLTSIYQADEYRTSDHDPVVALLKLGTDNGLGNMLYEDGNNGTANWQIIDNKPAAEIAVAFDLSLRSKVIQLKGSLLNLFRLTQPEGDELQNTTQTWAQWTARFNGPYLLKWEIITDSTFERIFFVSADHDDCYTTTWEPQKSILCGLSGTADTAWHTIALDLNAKLKTVAPSASITEVRWLDVRGNGAMDDILLFDKSPN